MKKFGIFISLLFLLVSCGDNKTENNKVLYLYGWADYVPSEIFDNFEKETGIKVIEDIYSSNEEMFAKLKAGGKGYDIVTPSTDYVEILMNENMLEKLDKSKLPTFDNIDPMVLEKIQYFDKDNSYAVPYIMGSTGIAVNTKYVKDYPRDYTIYERTDLAGRMTLLDDMREVLTSALGTLGYSQTIEDETAIAQASDLVKKWKKNIAKFDSESFGKGFANGDFWVVHGYAENIYQELDEEQRAHTDFIIPEKGDTAYVDSFVILKDAPNKEAAYKFLEFIHRPENYKLVSEHLELPSINVPARELIEVEPIYKMEDLKGSEILRDIKKTLDIQNKYWQEIMVD
ncbi:extracellular solute-binding protein [Cetobacterium sp. 2A]|uniref:extracellular solute-binding protein n=1 Tax=Cetobacterium sp. 2A TaxID=2754723 RepID=UPI00163C585F|nr:extracellular solute-binding protein [Cetobacterium sp. 2A]MBC2855267.1 extracellular solute-binding protein [Cetobacterium sp. 2A]MBC2855647.1 extracellular solute-binding protein [Cetobacterium sp. 2A]